MLRGTGTVTVPAGATQIVEFSAGAKECGYLEYELQGGAGARIDTLCSECYAYPGTPDPGAGMMGMEPKPLKGDRTDYRGGKLFGHVSHYTAAGYGTPEAPERYEPYWFRTFRYIQLRVTAAAEPLTISRFSYRATGYPLDDAVSFACSDESFAGVWDISLRTLRRCMHETYFDCPFYEQLQYAMDGRSEILYTYAVSADARLARQAMEAFRLSQRPDGMTNSDAPTVKGNVIPGFSIYYLLMVHDHMMYFGDKALARTHLPAIMRILDFFDGHLTEKGLVGRVGGPIMRARYWSFIDWAKPWSATGGVPTACLQGDGSVTMESLLYLLGLQKAKEIADWLGLRDLGAEYARRAEALSAAILRECAGDGFLLQDGPGVEEYSVHCQVFAILTGLVDAGAGRKMLAATLGNASYPQCSVAMQFYLFRALEAVGWYEKADELWELWRQMLRDRMTTCVENDTDARSDCHAWASTLLYELPSVYLGVRPAAPGCAKLRIRPSAGHLTWAKGTVPTPKGAVRVEWTKTEDGSLALQYDAPEGIEVLT